MKGIYVWLFSLLLICCGPKRDELRIRGKFDNLPQADLLLYSPDGGLMSIDTLHIVKGKFDYRTHVDKEGQYTYTIIYPNFMTLSFLAHTGTEIRIKGDALSLGQEVVEGADSILPSKRKPGRNPLAIGKKLPKSKLIKPDAKHYLLISFWADWKHGSSSVNYYTRQALEEFPDSLHAFSYSLDVNPKNYKLPETIKDSTRWKSYCDFTGWGGKILSQYGVRNIPLMILLGPDGKIRAMGDDYNKDIKPEISKIRKSTSPNP